MRLEEAWAKDIKVCDLSILESDEDVIVREAEKAVAMIAELREVADKQTALLDMQEVAIRNQKRVVTEAFYKACAPYHPAEQRRVDLNRAKKRKEKLDAATMEIQAQFGVTPTLYDGKYDTFLGFKMGEDKMVVFKQGYLGDAWTAKLYLETPEGFKHVTRDWSMPPSEFAAVSAAMPSLGEHIDRAVKQRSERNKPYGDVYVKHAVSGKQVAIVTKNRDGKLELRSYEWFITCGENYVVSIVFGDHKDYKEAAKESTIDGWLTRLGFTTQVSA